MTYIWQYVIYIGKSYRTNTKPIYCIIVFPETIMRHLILVQTSEAYEYNHMLVSMEALGNILALADNYNSSEIRQTLFYNDALIVPVWISIFCKRFINFQQVFSDDHPLKSNTHVPLLSYACLPGCLLKGLV